MAFWAIKQVDPVHLLSKIALSTLVLGVFLAVYELANSLTLEGWESYLSVDFSRSFLQGAAVRTPALHPTQKKA